MNVFFLGTGAGLPSTERNVTSIALRLSERGTFWLFDCGEGTQHQMLRSPLRPGKMEKIFITHLHGDHIYGLPGMLTSRSYQGGEEALALYGPPGISEYVNHALAVSHARIAYELQIIEITPGLLYEDDRYSVYTEMLDHRIDSYGYRIVEKPIPGALRADKLRALGIEPGPVYGKLKQGIDVTEGGTVLAAQDFVEPPVEGRIVTIAGDTRKCEAAVRLAENADVLVHESTYAHALSELAVKHYHSTAKEAAEIAVSAGARALIMTHISSRYQDDGAETLLDEARSIFPNSYLARDFWSFDVGRR